MLVGMSIKTARLSPTIMIATVLAYKKPAVWKPLAPKRFAWAFGATMITICWIYFNPEVVAGWVNTLAGSQILPETENYMSYYIPMVMVWVCIGFMWMEAVLGFCVGCLIHSLLVKLGVLKEECYECNNIDWDEIARKHQQKQAKASANGSE